MVKLISYEVESAKNIVLSDPSDESHLLDLILDDTTARSNPQNHHSTLQPHKTTINSNQNLMTDHNIRFVRK